MSVLQDKVIWVTGAGTGIGRAIAHMLAGQGSVLALMGRRKEVLEEVRDEVSKMGARGTETVPLDVADRESVLAAGKSLLEKYGRVDILVNNAGLNIPDRSLVKLQPEDWDKVIHVNLTGAYNMIHAVLPAMRKQKDGLIINVSSIAGVKPSSLAGTAYTASKFGVTGMTGVINEEEWSNGIRATALCPGEVNTPIMEKRPVKIPPEDLARMIQPEDMAAAVKFLGELPGRTHIPEMLVMPTHRRGVPV